MSITTVRGEVESSRITGAILPHEHLFINLRAEFRGIGLVNNSHLVLAEVEQFANGGGALIVDVTPAELTRGTFTQWNDDPTHLEMNPTSGSRAPANVEALQWISDISGVHVVASTGHYRDPYLDRAWFDRNEIETIANFMVQDIEVGFPGTDARAGVIGEIGSDSWYISAAEERSFRAAARAQIRTGVPVTTHAARWPTGLKQLEILQSEGVDPRKVIIGHVDTVTEEDYALALAEAGVWVQLDTFYYCRSGGQVVQHELDKRISLLERLLRAGHGDRVLLSHDACLTTHAYAAGGTGLSFLQEQVTEAAAKKGIDESTLKMLMHTNPLQAFTRE